MPSRVELRRRAEQVLRAIVIAALVVLLWQSLHEETSAVARSISARTVSRPSLEQWSKTPRPAAAIHVQLDSVPTPLERAWLRALGAAGSSITWSGNLPPLMIEAQPVAAPTGGTRVLVATADRSSVVVSDDIGVIDTVATRSAGAVLTLSSALGVLRARVNGSLASTAPRDSVVLHKVLVIGNAGWESKFVAAALEENGWKVDAFIRVAPTVEVTQGSPTVIDTSRYSAVIALDDAASPYANRIIAFARAGGGVVLGSQAASLDAMAPLRVGSVGRATSDARALQASGSVSLARLSLAPITSIRTDAVALDKRGAVTAVAARRFNAGRVLQLGYEDTWRWRMGGTDEAIRDHRLWWTELVSSVAYAPVSTGRAVATDDAPLADLVAAVGASNTHGFAGNVPLTQSTWSFWLFVLFAVALAAELMSRRLRGTA
ncbi:MAG: hypothetical protein ACJ78I_04685 [Gemmatimonadaceae bacterium]